MAINAEIYETQGINDELTQFEFISIGKKGEFPILIKFSPIDPTRTIWNLGFGVAVLDNQGFVIRIDDTIVIDNGDVNKIFATVAQKALDFLNIFPDRYVYFNGSDAIRTRKYRQILSHHFEEINPDYRVFSVRIENNTFTQAIDFVPNTGDVLNGFVIERR